MIRTTPCSTEPENNNCAQNHTRCNKADTPVSFFIIMTDFETPPLVTDDDFEVVVDDDSMIEEDDEDLTCYERHKPSSLLYW